MTKLVLAGVAALALSTGAAFAASAQPATDTGSAPAHAAQVTQRYDYLSQQQTTAPGYGVVSTPHFSWEGP